METPQSIENASNKLELVHTQSLKLPITVMNETFAPVRSCYVGLSKMTWGIFKIYWKSVSSHSITYISPLYLKDVEAQRVVHCIMLLCNKVGFSESKNSLGFSGVAKLYGDKYS